MARIELADLAHAYTPHPASPADWAVKPMTMIWEQGGAYALLGPSGCGKTTLLNIISGLVTPTRGRVLFDETDVTTLPTEKRNIAQVFQFPVIYDTMTVYDNLAFPLRNRRVDSAAIDVRVREVAAILELDKRLDMKARGLTADMKQKISLGRGLVRADVGAILFDEPLTVIDPQLKWQLRAKLKEVHERSNVTMVYVTHDQTEALTFADKVVVMKDGEIVQIGTPVDLFERPQHTFVGHFIGSPGMNVLPCEVKGGRAHLNGVAVETGNAAKATADGGRLELGVRPEFVSFAAQGIPVDVVKIADAGRYRVVETRLGERSIKMLVPEGIPIPTGRTHIAMDPAHTQVYQDGWMAGREAS